jgi:hypothetical protein
MKIVWYNILRGFHKKEEDKSLIYEPERLKTAKKIINKYTYEISKIF